MYEYISESRSRFNFSGKGFRKNTDFSKGAEYFLVTLRAFYLLLKIIISPISSIEPESFAGLVDKLSVRKERTTTRKSQLGSSSSRGIS